MHLMPRGKKIMYTSLLDRAVELDRAEAVAGGAAGAAGLGGGSHGDAVTVNHFP